MKCFVCQALGDAYYALEIILIHSNNGNDQSTCRSICHLKYALPYGSMDSRPDICFPLQQYGSHCSSMVPTAAVWFPLQQYGSHCSSMVPIAAVWFPLQQYGSHCSSMVPIAAVWFPLQQYGSQSSSMASHCCKESEDFL